MIRRARAWCRDHKKVTLTAGLVALVAAPITALADGIQISDSLWGEDKPVASTPPPGVPSAGLTSPASAPLSAPRPTPPSGEAS